MRPTATLAALLCIAPFAGAAPQKGTPEPEELIAAWNRLEAADRKDTVDWFVAECDRAQDFRAQLERYVLEQVGQAGVELPAAGDPPTYDPERHCPAQPIPRRFVNTSKGKHAKLAKGFLDPSARAMRPAVRYDWATGGLVRLEAWDTPERIAQNAALGFTPYTDLVEAWVLQQLDTGEMRATAEAFGHAYADRSGNAYREVTLYTAWSSGQEIEMPDVECLGIVHALDKDWKTYVAPVNPRLHRKLYTQIGDHFVPYRAYRDLRESIARTFVTYEPELAASYATTRDRLHGFWERAGSDPAKLAKELPGAKTWRDWFVKESRAVDADEELRTRTRSRMAALRRSESWARRTFHGILVEYGAFETKEPEGAGEPAGGGGGR